MHGQPGFTLIRALSDSDLRRRIIEVRDSVATRRAAACASCCASRRAATTRAAAPSATCTSRTATCSPASAARADARSGVIA
jgi:hypothetical protein